MDLFHVLYCSVRIEVSALASLFSGECITSQTKKYSGYGNILSCCDEFCVIYYIYFFCVEILSHFGGVSCRMRFILNQNDKNEIQAIDFSDKNKLRSPSSSFGDESFGHRGR